MKNFGLHSEYERLTAVLLYPPGPEVGNYPAPAEIQQLRPIDQPVLAREFVTLSATFAQLGITVMEIDPAPLSDDRSYLYNMMYCRDLFFMTPQGAILANMANRTRREEVRYAERALRSHGIPVLSTISGEGRFEGADAVWLKENLVLVGVGNRTNGLAFQQLQDILQELGVECVALPSAQTTTQHLLGTVQIVAKDLALVRQGIADPAVGRFLADRQFTVLDVPENDEVRERQAMNLVTVAPRRVIMPADCPETKALYERAGLTIVAELDISQLRAGAGGLACATGIIARG
jgi:N-dimethylarginine dimethylaminohydrolase